MTPELVANSLRFHNTSKRRIQEDPFQNKHALALLHGASVGLGSNTGEDMGVCERIVPLQHGGTLNSRRAASPLVCLVEGVERWEASDHLRASSLKIGVETSQIVLSPVTIRIDLKIDLFRKETPSLICSGTKTRARDTATQVPSSQTWPTGNRDPFAFIEKIRKFIAAMYQVSKLSYAVHSNISLSHRGQAFVAYPHRPMTLHSSTENSLAVLNHKILEANSQVQNVKLGSHQTCLSINRLWHELCDMLRRLVGTTVLMTILDRVLGARAAGVHYRLFRVSTLVPVRLDQQLSDHSTVDEIASGEADCRLTYTMANCPQRRLEKPGERRKKRENEKKEKKSSEKTRAGCFRKLRGESQSFLLGDVDQESEARMSKNALRTGRRQAVE
ncbi:hypothetical protein TNCV_600161 [Trichonephila clavipes]|nr:hypothetical protein TNCV_600161 [Trichonephila clavipes]